MNRTQRPYEKYIQNKPVFCEKTFSSNHMFSRLFRTLVWEQPYQNSSKNKSKRTKKKRNQKQHKPEFVLMRWAQVGERALPWDATSSRFEFMHLYIMYALLGWRLNVSLITGVECTMSIALSLSKMVLSIYLANYVPFSQNSQRARPLPPHIYWSCNRS